MKRSLAVLCAVAATAVQPACVPEAREPADNALVQNRGSDKDQWWAKLPRPEWAAFERVPQSQEWFEVYRVAAGVYAIYEPGQFEEVISYLIVGDERALLFDTGLGIGDIAKLVGELTPLEVVVLNSHTHYDHIGGNHAFATLFGTDSAYTATRARGLPHDEVAEFVGPGWIWMETPPGYDADDYAIRPFSIDRYVNDGGVIGLGGRQLEVLLTPGHAPDALCLIDRENRLLFTGDTFYLAPLYTHLEGSDFDDYVKTAQRLAALADDVDLLMPGHNVPAVSGRYLVELRDAFFAVAADDAPFVETDGNREYDFGGFSVITSAD